MLSSPPCRGGRIGDATVFKSVGSAIPAPRPGGESKLPEVANPKKERGGEPREAVGFPGVFASFCSIFLFLFLSPIFFPPGRAGVAEWQTGRILSRSRLPSRHPGTAGKITCRR